MARRCITLPGVASLPARLMQAAAGSVSQPCCCVCRDAHCLTHSVCRLQISIGDFDLIQRLGDGSFSTVVLGKYKGDGCCYAVKIVNKSLVLRNKVSRKCISMPSGVMLP